MFDYELFVFKYFSKFTNFFIIVIFWQIYICQNIQLLTYFKIELLFLNHKEFADKHW